MLNSMYSGISGLNANQKKLDVIGNNIANSGTTAFKASSVTFQDSMYQSLRASSAPSLNLGGTNPSQVGLGVSVQGINVNMNQGSLQPTGRPYDVAIDGKGYFVVAKGPIDGTIKVDTDKFSITSDTMETYFTRDGAFKLDPEGNLLTSNGYRIMGYKISDLNEKPDAAVKDLDAAMAIYNTAKDELKVLTDQEQGFKDAVKVAKENLDVLQKKVPAATEAEITTAKAAIKTAEDNLAKFYTDNNADLQTKKDAVEAAKKVVGLYDEFFDANSTNLSATHGELSALKIPETINKGGEEFRIQSFAIEKDGLIKAVLSDGSTTILGQVAMAGFNNEIGLEQIGQNMYIPSTNSGEAILRSGKGVDPLKDNGKAYGDMIQGSLEMSNVDLAVQFTDMIIASRSFQANSKIITTGDEILQELVNLKR